MPQPNFNYKKALTQGDKLFEALMTSKILGLVPDAEANWTNHTLFLKTSDSNMQKVTTYLADTYAFNIEVNQVGDEYAIDFI
jgi:hypothetical protein